MKLDNVNVSCIKCIGYYYNSSHVCHGTCLHLDVNPFYFKAIYFWSCLL